MPGTLVAVCLAATAACGPVEQPASMRAVEAWEIPLATRQQRARFLGLLDEVARGQGYHLDALSEAELEAISLPSSPIRLNASIWRGEDDEEIMANALDMVHPGHAWLTFTLGEEPARSTRLRRLLVARIKREWPDAARLPISVHGTIPLPDDLELTPSGYRLKQAAEPKYADDRHPAGEGP